MFVIKSLIELPQNFSEFINEMIPPYRDIYGSKATAHYEKTVQFQLGTTFTHESTMAFAAYEAKRAIGIVLAQKQGDRGQIAFVHVLNPHNQSTVASDLIQRVTDELRNEGASSIIMDCIPLCRLHIDQVMKANSFLHVKRMLMSYDLCDRPVVTPSTRSTECTNKDFKEGAALFLEAFKVKTEPVLYDDLKSPDRIIQTIRNYRSGGYGRIKPEWSRVVRYEGSIKGMAFGTAISDDIGFVFQLAVDPTAQNEGIGSELLCSLLCQFTEAGMETALLGVTREDDAYRLYTRLGFIDKCPVSIYVWSGKYS